MGVGFEQPMEPTEPTEHWAHGSRCDLARSKAAFYSRLHMHNESYHNTIERL